MFATDDRLLLAYRRLFETDQPRVFAGAIEALDRDLVWLAGYSWARDPGGSAWIRAAAARTLVVAPAAPSHFLFVLPPTVDVGALRIDAQGGKILVTAPGFEMDLPELRLGTSGRWN